MVPWSSIHGLVIGSNVFCIVLYAVAIELAKRYNAGEVGSDKATERKVSQ